MSYLITCFISDHLMYSQSCPHTINHTLPVSNTTSAYLIYITKQQSGLPLLVNVNNSSNNWYLHLLSTSRNVAMQTVLIRSHAISATGKQHIGTLMMATTIKWCITEIENCSACTSTQTNEVHNAEHLTKRLRWKKSSIHTCITWQIKIHLMSHNTHHYSSF